jgi:pyruvate ferredoxin oxidoreductase beta subunit
VVEWLKTEGRFQHLFRDEHQDVLNRIQREVDERWARLLKLCGET